jgi:hypothetical protein
MRRWLSSQSLFARGIAPSMGVEDDAEYFEERLRPGLV